MLTHWLIRRVFWKHWRRQKQCQFIIILRQRNIKTLLMYFFQNHKIKCTIQPWHILLFIFLYFKKAKFYTLLSGSVRIIKSNLLFEYKNFPKRFFLSSEIGLSFLKDMSCSTFNLTIEFQFLLWFKLFR